MPDRQRTRVTSVQNERTEARVAAPHPVPRISATKMARFFPRIGRVPRSVLRLRDSLTRPSQSASTTMPTRRRPDAFNPPSRPHPGSTSRLQLAEASFLPSNAVHPPGRLVLTARPFFPEHPLSSSPLFLPHPFPPPLKGRLFCYLLDCFP